MNNTTAPLVSVIIPTYNHAQFLGKALESVIEQTYKNWEAIVIDNHSTDNTGEVMRRFADPRISYLNIDNNGVIAASRNMGICAARGEWVAFLDSDDWWSIDKLQVCLDYIDGADIIYHDLRIEREKRSMWRTSTLKSRQLRKPVLIDLLNNGNLIPNSSVIIRRKLLQRIGGISENAKMIASEDYNTWLRVAKVTNLFFHVPQTLGCYRVHRSSVSQRNISFPLKCATDEFVELLTVVQRDRLNSTIYYICGRHQYKNREYDSALYNIKECIKGASVRNRVAAAATLVLIFIRLCYGKFVRARSNE